MSHLPIHSEAETVALRRAYGFQKRRAKQRGIAWLFTFDTWLATWVESGRLAQRGMGIGRYVMARPGDVGPYSPSNVEITLHEKNCGDARRNHPKTHAQMAAPVLGKGRGWSYVKNGYQVVVCHKYIGRFPSAQLAEIAYAEEVERVRTRLANSMPAAKGCAK